VLHIVFEQRGRTVEADVLLTEDPTLEVVTIEETGVEADARMIALRESWLWH